MFFNRLAQLLSDWVVLAQALLGIAFVLRLAQCGLLVRFPWMATYLAVDAAFVAFRAWLPTNSGSLLTTLYWTGDAVEVLLSIQVVRELVGLVLEEHPAVAAYARRMTSYLFLVIAIVAGLNIFWDPALRGSEMIPWLNRFYALERAVSSATFATLMAIALTTWWFPLKVRNNVAALVSGWMVGGVAQWVMLLAANADVSHSGQAPLIALNSGVAWAACLVWWLLRIGPAGELRQQTTGPDWNRTRLDHLAQRLDSMNAQLDAVYSQQSVKKRV